MLKVISNSTPIIALCAIDQLDILKKMYGEIIVPSAVRDEVNSKENIIKDNSFFKVIKIKNNEAKKLFKMSLHPGEVEVLILANEIKSDLCIIDDLLARKYANYLAIKITGTLGVLIKAKQNGIIEKIKPLLDELIKNGIFISKELYTVVLNCVNE